MGFQFPLHLRLFLALGGFVVTFVMPCPLWAGGTSTPTGELSPYPLKKNAIWEYKFGAKHSKSVTGTVLKNNKICFEIKESPFWGDPEGKSNVPKFSYVSVGQDGWYEVG